MSRTDAKSLLLRMAPHTHSLIFRQLSLPMREHDGTRLPVSHLRPATLLLQEFRNQLRQAEEMVAKLGYHLRELQIPRGMNRGPGSDLSKREAATTKLADLSMKTSKVLQFRPTVGKVLRFKARTAPLKDEPESDKF